MILLAGLLLVNGNLRENSKRMRREREKKSKARKGKGEGQLVGLIGCAGGPAPGWGGDCCGGSGAD